MTASAARVGYRSSEVRVTAAKLAEWEVEQADPLAPPTAMVGNCPRCGDQMTASLVTAAPITSSVEADLAFAPPIDLTKQLTRRIECRCSQPHVGRPADKSEGCGAFWYISLTAVDDSWALGPADPALVRAADALEAEIARTRIDDVRKTAEKWLAGLTALYGLFSVSGAVIGKDTASALSHDARVAVACLGLTAIVSAVVSIVSGYLAAYGWPSVKPANNDEELLAWFKQRDRDEQRRVPRAIEHLHRAVLAATAALALLSAAVGVLWLGPQASPPKPLVRITATVKGTISSTCGELGDSADTSVKLQVTDGPHASTEAIPAGSITKWEIVKKC